ncbi:MAG: pyruvate formate-lyase-activating protein [Alloprevotella sp.]
MKQLRVHSYESMGTFDGPGLRFVVFLQGCPFRCLYCANPDTIDPVGESKLTDPDYIYDQVVSMKAFFGRRGGVTFSGGEPTVQAEALVPLCQRLKEAGFHICIDSNGTVWNEHVEALFRTVDLVLLDVKEIDPERHETITSRSNARTLETAAWLEREGHPFWLRYVLVPGLSNDDDHLHRLGRHFADYKQIERVELLPYHTLGVHKYEAMGLDYKLKGVKENTPEQLDHAAAILRTYFPQLVVN